VVILDPGTSRPKPIVELFFRLGPEDLAAIQNAADADALQRGAHKLKGTASILGMRRLAAACKQLDETAKAGDFEAARALIPGLVDDFNATCEALRDEAR
jgi:HPt (histidine-containing phosphotransfer) domain-containing protein